MLHTSTSTHPRLRGARRSDATLRRTALIAAAAFAALTIAGLIRSLAAWTPGGDPVPPASPPSAGAVLVLCSDGWTCAVPPSRGEGRTVNIHWKGKPLPPGMAEQMAGEDPGAAL